MEEKWKEGDKEREVEERERAIRELKARLQHKESVLHVSSEHTAHTLSMLSSSQTGLVLSLVYVM